MFLPPDLKVKRVLISLEHVNAPCGYLSTAVKLIAKGNSLLSMMDDVLYCLFVVILECSSTIVTIGNQAAITYMYSDSEGKISNSTCNDS